jgi:phenylacetate-CoA ligase
VVEQPAGADEMTLLIEGEEPAEDAARIAEAVQAVTKLRGSVRRVPPGSLPDDGKLIEDRRKLD